MCTRTFSFCLAALSATQSFGQVKAKDKDLTNLGLEDLMKVQVTTASKSAEAVSKVPAAIYVITQDTIHRAGAKNIPDALRLAPGVDVAQINANEWEVTIRGFNNRFSDKLLVLLDGRSVYTPDFAGVYWDELDMPMDSIDRIEVIRGPGGSLWGANAVNGVVNIITKHASETLGDTLNIEGGTLDRFVGSFEHGQALGENRFLRVFAKYSDVAAFNLYKGGPGPDAWESEVGGFRFDDGKPQNNLMIEGSLQSAHEGEETILPDLSAPYHAFQNNRYSVANGNLVGRWERSASNGAQQTLQASVAADKRPFPEAQLQRTTVDLDYQTEMASWGRHKVTIGTGYRVSPDKLTAGETVSFDPSQETFQVGSLFLHDNWSLNPKTNFLYGSKIDYSSTSGWDVQPNFQLLYTPDPSHTWWGAVSRAVGTPTRADLNSQIDYASMLGPGGVPVLIHLRGNPGFDNDKVWSSEIGYRARTNSHLFLSGTLFDNRYNDLRSVELLGMQHMGGSTPYIEANYTFGNKLYGQTDGAELEGQLYVTDRWKLTAMYSYFTERLRLQSGSTDNLGYYAADGRGGALKNEFQLRSNLDLARGVQFDTDLYYMDAPISHDSPAYWRLDCRLEWAATPKLRFTGGVQNALQPNHREAQDWLFTSVEQIPRSAYLNLTYKF